MDDIEKTTLLGLLTKYATDMRLNTDDRALVAAAEARIDLRQDRMEQLKGTFAVYGFDVSRGFLELRKALGVSDYNEALVRAGYDRMSLSYAVEGPSIRDQDDSAPLQTEKTVRDFALERLKSAGTAGMKASEIRKFIEAARGTELHEKTVGMTLYRLSLEGLARRDGRTWFSAEPSGEAKNPGAATPGLFNSVDQKE